MFTKRLFLGFSIIFLLSHYPAPDFLEWSEARPLKFEDFKASVPSNATKSVVNLSTQISYEIRQEQGKPPQIKILNLMDRNASWVKVKKPEILEIQQIQFDYAELYARKIRKKMSKMVKNGELDKEKYIAEISRVANLLHKKQHAQDVLLEDQPHLIKIMRKDVTDSLNKYKDFIKQN